MLIYNQMVVDQLSDADVDRVFHALADATRRDIVRLVFDGSQYSISDLARRYPMSITAVQKHVGVLEGAGLVIKERHGREQRGIGRIAAVRRAQELLDQFDELWRGRIGRMAELLAETDEGEQS